MEKAAIEVLEKCHRQFGNRTWERLMQKHEQGKTDWDDPITYPPGEILSQLIKATNEERWLDVSNLALFLWNREDEKSINPKDYA